MSKALIRMELKKCLVELDQLILATKESAKDVGVFEGGVSPYKMMNVNGELVLTPLLVAKAQVLSALAGLERL